ncbi:hypothetical protein, partial [Hansschlegelia zhihuaiae]|uniref:hypothetical protein n=2 Tax=Hansschlegelia TaxID=444599 RepID=UPI001FE13FD1
MSDDDIVVSSEIGEGRSRLSHIGALNVGAHGLSAFQQRIPPKCNNNAHRQLSKRPTANGSKEAAVSTGKGMPPVGETAVAKYSLPMLSATFSPSNDKRAAVTD